MQRDAEMDDSNVVAFLDMDSFEVQLYQNKSFPNYRGQPCIVADNTGRIVSASHEAKTFGISRNIRLDKAREMCHNLQVIIKPTRFNKPDAMTPRHGSWAVFDSLKNFCNFGADVVLEYASSDGFFVNITEEINQRMQSLEFVDITENVFLEERKMTSGCMRFHRKREKPEIFKLMCASTYLTDMAATLLAETGMECSVGISCNKLLAKVACQLHKPRGITVIPFNEFGEVLQRKSIDIRELPGFGRTLGESVKARLGIDDLTQLSRLNLGYLERVFGHQMGRRLFDGSHGICDEPVIIKDVNNSLTCGKSFHGGECGMGRPRLLSNLENLADEMAERLTEERQRHRRETNSLQIQFTYQDDNGFEKTRNKSFPVSPHGSNGEWNLIHHLAFEEIQNTPGIHFNPWARFSRLSLNVKAWQHLDDKDKSNIVSAKLIPPRTNNNQKRTSNKNEMPTAFCGFAMAVPYNNVEVERKPGPKVYQLKITLNKVQPSIWRTIQIPEHFTFYELHHAIQDAVGWDHSIIHEFEACGVFIGTPNEFFEGIKEILPEKQTHVSMFLQEIGDTVIYQHGFNEEWPHTIILEGKYPVLPGLSYPQCIDGKRAAPPADCEDLFAFQELLEAFKNPGELKELQQGGFYLDYDPERFTPAEVNFNHVVFNESDED